MLSDADLIVRARKGQESAFAALVRRYQGAARSFAARVLAHDGDAEDIAQEAFVFAWEHLARLKTPERFKTWLLGIVFRKAQTRTRSRLRAKARDGAWQSAYSDAVDHGGEAAVTALQLFAQLSVDQRAALALCHGEGWSHAQAADILGVPVGTVKSHLTRGKARLKEIMEAGHGPS